jgi:transcriptional regulator with XRE-family HTH domain
MNSSLSNFGARVRERRAQEGWTQEALADRVGISRTYLSHIEQGQAKNLSYRLAQELAAVLGIEVPAASPAPSSVPPSLQAYATKAGLADRDVETLAGIQYRGQRPTTEEQWRILHELIRATIGNPPKGEG